MTKILFIDNGINFDSTIFREKPLGGAEVAFVSLVEELAKLKYEVVVYNNCINTGLIKGVYWKKLNSKINDENFDVLVINRGDKYLNFKKQCKRRIFWIHNPANYLLKYRYLSKLLFNKPIIVFSSNYHCSTYPQWAPAKKKIVIPYGVDQKLKSKKIKLPKPHAIFTSNPMRKLDWILDRWEKEIFPKISNAKLKLFAGIETYGSFGNKHKDMINRILFKAKSLKNRGVKVSLPLSREKLFNQIRKSRVLMYKGTSDETFCMAVAESQVLGIPAVVCNEGCLNERVINDETGYVCESEKEFSVKSIKLLKDDKTWMRMHKNLLCNNNHIDWSEVARKWKRIID